MPIVLYHPDIPQNVGSMLRLSACFGVPLHIIEPCGFAFDDRRLKRTAMDYWQHATLIRHRSWQAFRETAGKEFVVVTPGVRPVWAAHGDQKRIITPAEAIQGGADYIVVGRPITQHASPAEAASKILAELG